MLIRILYVDTCSQFMRLWICVRVCVVRLQCIFFTNTCLYSSANDTSSINVCMYNAHTTPLTVSLTLVLSLFSIHYTLFTFYTILFGFICTAVRLLFGSCVHDHIIDCRNLVKWISHWQWKRKNILPFYSAESIIFYRFASWCDDNNNAIILSGCRWCCFCC